MRVTFSLVQVAMAMLDMDHTGDGRIWGYALSKESGVRSGVLYPQLDRMLSEGWLEDDWESAAEVRKRPPRRYYRLTDAGRQQLGAVVRQAAQDSRFAQLRLVHP